MKLASAVVLLVLCSCHLLARLHEPPPLAVAGQGAQLIALGTVQDGGLPHASCGCERCTLARESPEHRRFVASLALWLPEERETWLIDATPNLPYQLEILRLWNDRPRNGVDRQPVDGVFLTHAHIGHYLGLAHLGFEVVHTRELTVYATRRMGQFLSYNGPWSQLVRKRNIELRTLRAGRPVQIANRVRVTPVRVPHRDEYSDTVGFRIEGLRSTVLYVPDTDGWDTWTVPLSEHLAGVDVAILDGSFFSLDELPGRSIDEVRHPLITETMDRLQPLVGAGLIVYFTHMNHTNPVLGPGTEAAEYVRERGFRILEEGWRWEL